MVNKFKKTLPPSYDSNALRISVIIILTLLTLSVDAQVLSQQDERFADSVMNANYTPTGPGAVLLIAKNGKPVFRKAYGLASLELNISQRYDYAFDIASMSKQFTAVCILKLAQEGKLNLQDDIRKHLPTYNTHGRHISIENILTHTSGIMDYTEKNEYPAKSVTDQSKEELMNFFMNDSLRFEPGTNWSYCNSGYVVAGLIVEHVSGMPLSKYLKQTIFEPVGMSHSYVGNLDSIMVNATNGYDTESEGKYKRAKYLSWSWLFGAGGIVTTVDDLLLWDNALYTEKILKQEWLQKAWQSGTLTNGQKTNYGCGWAIADYHGLKLIEHGGINYGYRADALRIPSQHLYAVILSNNGYVWPIPFFRDIILHVAGQPLSKPVFTAVDRKTLLQYPGVYAGRPSDPKANLTYQYLSLRNDTLFSQHAGHSKDALLSVGKDRFAGIYGNPYYQFHRDKKGAVMSIEIYDEPVQYGPHQLNFKTERSLPKEKQAVRVDPKKLELLTGKYDLGGGAIIRVTVEENKIYMQLPGQNREEIFAENEVLFFSKTTDGSIEFMRTNGNVSQMILKVDQTYVCKKID